VTFQRLSEQNPAGAITVRGGGGDLWLSPQEEDFIHRGWEKRAKRERGNENIFVLVMSHGLSWEGAVEGMAWTGTRVVHSIRVKKKP